MGRLIDADEVNEAIYKSFEDIQFYDGTGYDIYSDSKKIIDKIPTVEAIPKADYEARLKADMVAMLEELKKEIIELPFPQREPEYMQGYSYCQMNILDYVIQEKIDKLKGEEDG